MACCHCLWATAVTVFLGCLLSTSLADKMKTRAEQKEYLKRFAYLGDQNPDPEIQELRDHPDEQFKKAIMNFQRFAGLNITGVVDDATIRMMQMPRCGVSDVQTMSSIARRRKRYAIAGSKWNRVHLTYRFINYTPDLPRATVRRVFEEAFRIWSDVSALTFTETTGTADIKIQFARGYHGDNGPFDGQGNTLAHAFFPGTGIGGDAHFDEDEIWTDRTRRGTNLLQVAVHELGHSLGLGHSDVQSAIMAPFYRGYNASFRLDQDDIDGIRHLYGDSGSGGPPTTMGPRPTTTRRTTTVTGVLPPATTTAPPPPGQCPLVGFCRDFDAIDVIDNAIYVFKGRYYAKLNSQGALVLLGRIDDRWPTLPNNLDAALSTWRYVYFFKGSDYWRLDKITKSIIQRPIRQGFPRAPENMDAAFVWSGNGRIYFIKGNQYYRFRGGYGVDAGYPKSLSVWRGVKGPVNDVVQYGGVTYFFSGDHYQIFNDFRFIAGEQKLTKELMECCPERQQQSLVEHSGAASAVALKMSVAHQSVFTAFFLMLVSSSCL